ncbi:hypothetical protein [Virgibacillus sp. AGTR]|uniref:hypothetical protein n=1 Tax=Virgibacillus sp. AGTR TaxID=2812055 RepID=UPI0035B39555
MKHVKENDLAHGEFGKWLEEVDTDWNVANRMMKVSEEIGVNSDTYHNLGLNALYLIATLPPDERTSTHTTATGEEKTPDEMTVRELRELKRQLKATEAKAQQAQQARELSDEDNRKLAQTLTEERNKPPEVKYETRTEYVKPDDYDELLAWSLRKAWRFRT